MCMTIYCYFVEFQTRMCPTLQKLNDCVLHQAPIMDFSIRMKTVLVYQMPHFQQHARCNHEHVATHGCLVIVYLLLKRHVHGQYGEVACHTSYIFMF